MSDSNEKSILESKVRWSVVSGMLLGWIERTKAGVTRPAQLSVRSMFNNVAQHHGMASWADFLLLLDQLERLHGVVRVTGEGDELLVELTDPMGAYFLLDKGPAWVPDDLATAHQNGFLTCLSLAVGSLCVGYSQQAHDDGDVQIQFSPFRGDGVGAVVTRLNGEKVHVDTLADLKIVFRAVRRNALYDAP